MLDRCACHYTYLSLLPFSFCSFCFFLQACEVAIQVFDALICPSLGALARQMCMSLRPPFSLALFFLLFLYRLVRWLLRLFNTVICRSLGTVARQMCMSLHLSLSLSLCFCSFCFSLFFYKLFRWLFRYLTFERRSAAMCVSHPVSRGLPSFSVSRTESQAGVKSWVISRDVGLGQSHVPALVLWR